MSKSVEAPPPAEDEQVNPCISSPCGPNAECKVNGNSHSCSCLNDFIGNPPNCRPECISNSECPSNLACIKLHCRDPCPGSCGFNAECHVVSHTPVCVCLNGYEGDPFVQCHIKQTIIEHEEYNPCMPSPCGSNAICREQMEQVLVNVYLNISVILMKDVVLNAY